jgi:hypothetical protein
VGRITPVIYRILRFAGGIGARYGHIIVYEMPDIVQMMPRRPLLTGRLLEYRMAASFAVVLSGSESLAVVVIENDMLAFVPNYVPHPV